MQKKNLKTTNYKETQKKPPEIQNYKGVKETQTTTRTNTKTSKGETKQLG